MVTNEFHVRADNSLLDICRTNPAKAQMPKVPVPNVPVRIYLPKTIRGFSNSEFQCTETEYMV